MRWIRLSIAVAMSVVELFGQTSNFHPGVHADTPAAANAEQAAEDAWFGHVRFLAGDELKGRRTGTAEFVKAADYVEAQFRSIGLRPAGVSGYRQPVGFRSAEVDAEGSAFVLVRPDGQTVGLRLGTEATLAPNEEGPVAVEAPAVFAGHGLVVPELGVDDLKGLDLHGKIAVILGGAPAQVHGPLRAYFRATPIRWAALRRAGAVGVVTIPEPRPQPAGQGPGQGSGPGSGSAPGQGSGQGPGRRSSPPGAARPVEQLREPVLNPLGDARLVATVPQERAAVLFAGGPHPLDELLALARAGRPLPGFPLAVRIRASTVTRVLSRYEAPNVVGVLPGGDPALERQYLLVTAHLDHLGVRRGERGEEIYPGAMDNASGIASLIETARALARGPRPRRSIVFIALTGEEEGELGSQYYALHPTVPRAQIIADLNMDMYLPLFPLHFLEVQGLGESTLGNDARAAAQLNDIEVQFDKQPDENRFVRSDQASFIRFGIPGLAFKFGWLPDSPEQKIFNDWIHDRYHRPADDLSQPIEKEAAVHFDKVLETLVTRVADAPARPTWYPESFFSTIPRR